MATPAIRTLVFSPLPAGEANQNNSSKRSRDRQKALVASLSKYEEGKDISKWFAEFIDRANGSYLNNNKGCIINVLMATVPTDTTLGDDIRESFKANWERERREAGLSVDINDNVTAGLLLDRIVHNVQVSYPKDLGDTLSYWVSKQHKFNYEKSDSIQSYYNRCSKIVRKLASHGQACTDAQVKNMYLEGLPKRIRGDIKEKNVVGNVTEIHRATMQYVQNKELEAEFPLHGKKVASEDKVAAIGEPEIKEGGTDQAKSSDESFIRVKRSWFQKPCSKCKGSEDPNRKKSAQYHSWGNCWQNPEGVSTKKRNKGSKRERDMSKVKCFKCQKFGHYANNCPDKAKKTKPEAKRETVAKVTEEKEVLSKAQIDEKIMEGLNAILAAKEQEEFEKAKEVERLARVVESTLKKHNLI
jgi:hypothetical protein